MSYRPAAAWSPRSLHWHVEGAQHPHAPPASRQALQWSTAAITSRGESTAGPPLPPSRRSLRHLVTASLLALIAPEKGHVTNKR
eukprot:6346797-Prymnesium_polylepis.1